MPFYECKALFIKKRVDIEIVSIVKSVFIDELYGY